MSLALAGCAAAGALALSSSSQRWLTLTATRPRPLPPVVEVLTGGQAAPLVAACGLLLLAAAVAVPAVRGTGRVAVGLLVVAAGVGLVWSGFRALTGGLTAAAAAETVGRAGGGAGVTGALSAGWPAVVVAAGGVAALAGLLVVARGRHWPGMGRRYERSGSPAVPDPAAAPARAQTPEDRHQAAWRALDRGEDPTEDPTGNPTPDGRAAPPAHRAGPTV